MKPNKIKHQYYNNYYYELDSFKNGVKEAFAQVTNDLENIIEKMKKDAEKQLMETNKTISSLQNKLDEA